MFDFEDATTESRYEVTNTKQRVSSLCAEIAEVKKKGTMRPT